MFCLLFCDVRLLESDFLNLNSIRLFNNSQHLLCTYSNSKGNFILPKYWSFINSNFKSTFGFFFILHMLKPIQDILTHPSPLRRFSTLRQPCILRKEIILGLVYTKGEIHYLNRLKKSQEFASADLNIVKHNGYNNQWVLYQSFKIILCLHYFVFLWQNIITKVA